VIGVGAVELAGEHATLLETGDRNPWARAVATELLEEFWQDADTSPTMKYASNSSIEYWAIQLDDVAREDPRPSFHVLAEGMHSDVRCEIVELTEEAPLSLPHLQWPHHLFIVIAISGRAQARLAGKTLELRPFSQLVVRPGAIGRLLAHRYPRKSSFGTRSRSSRQLPLAGDGG
jgi:hypothetical protein